MAFALRHEIVSGSSFDHSPVEVTEEDKTHVFGRVGVEVLGNVASLERNSYCQSDMVKKITVDVDEKLLHERLNKGVVEGLCIIIDFPDNGFVLENIVVFSEAKLAQPSDNRARVFAILMNDKEQSHAIQGIKGKLGAERKIIRDELVNGYEQPFEQTSLSGRRKRAPPVEAVVAVEDNLHTHRWVWSRMAHDLY
jgi:hypothetical protein